MQIGERQSLVAGDAEPQAKLIMAAHAQPAVKCASTGTHGNCFSMREALTEVQMNYREYREWLKLREQGLVPPAKQPSRYEKSSEWTALKQLQADILDNIA